MRRNAWFAAVLLLAAGSARAQTTAGIEEFLADHGRDLYVQFDFATGYPAEVFGHAMNLGLAPRTDAEFEAAAHALVERYPGMFGYTTDSLGPARVRRLALGRIGTSDKVFVGLPQEADGLRVTGGGLDLVFAADGRLVSISNHGLPGVADLDLYPTVSEETAVATAAAAFGRPVGELRGLELLVAPDAGRARPVLAWSVELRARDPENDLPVGERLTIDARTGALVRRESTVHTCTDLPGTVTGYGTPGTKPDTASNPPVQGPLQAVRVNSRVGSTNTAADGTWTIPYGGSSVQEVNTAFGELSLYAWVTNTAGANLRLTQFVTPGVPAAFVFNSSPTQFNTSQVNAQKEMLAMLDFIAAIDPTDTTMFFRSRLNVNINSSCNAYFDGSSTNYYRSGGGCPNTAYSTVIVHEEGHWANVRYGQGNGGDGFGEGNSDNWGMYVYDTPLVGEDFFGPGTWVRTGNNTRHYCGTCCAGCYGEVHNDGEVLMGACWKVRANLNASLGDVAGDLVADTLFLGWMNAYPGDRCICDRIRNHWLVLDDDDHNLANGSPHFADIEGGFVAQGFPPFG